MAMGRYGTGMKTSTENETDWLDPIRDAVRDEIAISSWLATAGRLGIAVNTLQNLLGRRREPVASTIGRLMAAYGFRLAGGPRRPGRPAGSRPPAKGG